MDDRVARAVARRFTDGVEPQVERHPQGHIHETWFVTASHRALVLQRLNDQVFPDCVLMMDNVLRVSTHLARRRPERPCLTVAAADDGSLVVYDDHGRPWRAFNRVPGATTPEVISAPEAASEVGRAFGAFLADVQSLPGPTLMEPIPGFKDFERRRADFDLVVDVDPFGRAEACQAEIADVRRHHRLAQSLAEALAAGRLPVRIVHNDAKAANVLLDTASGRALCVVDLDTVAPGNVLFDIGDLLRTATITSAEDDENPDDRRGPAVRDNFLVAVLGGYLSEAGETVTASERALIPLAGPLMAYESALRFLTDHLAGDSYFRIHRPRHNLDRARTQLRVLASLERAADRVASLTGV